MGYLVERPHDEEVSLITNRTWLWNVANEVERQVNLAIGKMKYMLPKRAADVADALQNGRAHISGAQPNGRYAYYCQWTPLDDGRYGVVEVGGLHRYFDDGTLSLDEATAGDGEYSAAEAVRGAVALTPQSCVPIATARSRASLNALVQAGGQEVLWENFPGLARTTCDFSCLPNHAGQTALQGFEGGNVVCNVMARAPENFIPVGSVTRSGSRATTEEGTCYLVIFGSLVHAAAVNTQIIADNAEAAGTRLALGLDVERS